jgi:hypothetical protein
MDQRDIEEHGKDRGEGWGIGIKKVFFFKFLGIVLLC